MFFLAGPGPSVSPAFSFGCARIKRAINVQQQRQRFTLKWWGKQQQRQKKKEMGLGNRKKYTKKGGGKQSRGRRRERGSFETKETVRLKGKKRKSSAPHLFLAARERGRTASQTVGAPARVLRVLALPTLHSLAPLSLHSLKLSATLPLSKNNQTLSTTPL